MPDNSMLYPNTPTALQPSPATAPAGGAPKTGGGTPVLGNGPDNSAAAANALHSTNLWGAPSSPSFLSPATLAYMGVDTSKAPPGMLFNAQTQQWEAPPADWAGMGGARVDSFGGGAPAASPANPAATAEHVTTTINGLLDGTHPALKAGAGGTVGSTTQPTGGGVAPGANGAYGTWGNLRSRYGATQNVAGLPDWVASQFQDSVNVDEGGAQTHNWSLNENPWGGFKGQDGQYYVQVGDPSSWKPGDQDGGVKDRSLVTYDPGGGFVTPASNLHDSGIGGPDGRMIATVLGAGALGAFAGLGAEAAGAGAAGAGSSFAGGAAGAEAGGGVSIVDTGLSGLFAGSPALAPGVGAAGAGAAGAGAVGAGAGGEAAAGGGAAAGTGAAGAGAGAAGTGASGAGAAGAGAAGAGSGIGAILNPAARILAPAIIGQVLHPSGGGAGHPSTGLPGGSGTGSGASGGTSNAYDALGQSLIDNKPLADAARATLLNHGKPTDDQTSAINAGLAEHRRIGQEQILQASANSGQGGADSMVVQDKMRAFDTQLETQRQELMQKQAEANTSNALQELGYISKEMQAYAELQFRENESLQELYSGLFQALGYLYGTTPGTHGTTPTLPGVTTPDPATGDPTDPNDGIPTDPNGELQFDP